MQPMKRIKFEEMPVTEHEERENEEAEGYL